MFKKLFPFALVAVCAACQANDNGPVAPTNATTVDAASQPQADASTQPGPDTAPAAEKPLQACDYNTDCFDKEHPCDVVRTCQAGVCKPLLPAQFAPKGDPCDDGSACTTGELCDGKGFCKGGAAPNCEDNNECTSDSCDPKVGCVHSLLAGGDCDDGNACTSADACKGGACVGAVADCDDKNPCTDDTCDKAKGCQHKNNAAECSDDNPCTVGDKCSAGKCEGKPVECNDNNECSTDTCDAKLGCQHANVKDGTECDDGNASTVSDECSAGECKGIAEYSCKADKDCAFLASKCEIPFCITELGICDTKLNKVDDGNPCTADVCDPAKGPVNKPISASCDDGNACTTADACVAGACKGSPKQCDDGDKCTEDFCDSSKGCLAKPADVAVMCDDKNWWTADTCDSTAGCQWTPYMFTLKATEPEDLKILNVAAPSAMLLALSGTNWGYFTLYAAPDFTGVTQTVLKVPAKMMCEAYDIPAGVEPARFTGLAVSKMDKGKTKYVLGGSYITATDPSGGTVKLKDLGQQFFNPDSNEPLASDSGPNTADPSWWCAKFKK